MPAIVEYPQVVQKALLEFAHIFSCEPQRKHFAEYLTGLMIAQNKTVTGSKKGKQKGVILLLWFLDCGR